MPKSADPRAGTVRWKKVPGTWKKELGTFMLRAVGNERIMGILRAFGILFFLGVAVQVRSAQVFSEPPDLGDLSVEERLQLLEAQIRDHENKLREKIHECKLEYRPVGSRSNWCADGAVVTSVERIAGTELVRVTCARPVLKCEKLKVEMEL
jgi:hypothetical protein